MGIPMYSLQNGLKYQIKYNVDSANLFCTTAGTLKNILLTFQNPSHLDENRALDLSDVRMDFSREDGSEFCVFGDELIEVQIID